jgi:hypothetical protein
MPTSVTYGQPIDIYGLSVAHNTIDSIDAIDVINADDVGDTGNMLAR